MTRTSLGLIALLTLGGAGMVQAQNPGLPVINSGVNTGITLRGEVGFPNADAGKGTAFGGTGKLGFGPFGVSATVSSYKPSGGTSQTSVGGTANLKVFGGPLIPFALWLQGGAAYTKSGTVKDYHFPIGLALAVNIPSTVVAIKPWIAPRVDVEHISIGPLPVPTIGSRSLGPLLVPAGTTPVSGTETHFGISGGVEFSLLNGLGFYAAYDWVSWKGAKPSTLGIGAQYGFSIPGL